MSTGEIISLAALAFACISCAFLGVSMLMLALGWRRLNRQLRRDRLTEYRPTTDITVQGRPRPRWMPRETRASK